MAACLPVRISSDNRPPPSLKTVAAHHSLRKGRPPPRARDSRKALTGSPPWDQLYYLEHQPRGCRRGTSRRAAPPRARFAAPRRARRGLAARRRFGRGVMVRSRTQRRSKTGSSSSRRMRSASSSSPLTSSMSAIRGEPSTLPPAKPPTTRMWT